ncbi:MAG: 4Fe-4S binding protein [Syntrophobacter sp.]
MIANYGYKDGAGDFFITIDTGRCDGCGACAGACPAECFEVGQDPNDPLRDEPVAIVSEAVRKSIRYACGQCKRRADHAPLPCMEACPRDAISHSW